jgi:aarF domain-containing kinase
LWSCGAFYHHVLHDTG